MILSNGKVVGDVGAQCKEVRDNRGNAKEKVPEGVTKTGQQIVLVEQQNSMVPQ